MNIPFEADLCSQRWSRYFGDNSREVGEIFSDPSYEQRQLHAEDLDSVE